MRRILPSIFIAILALLLITSTVLAAWSFAFPISVADTGGSDRIYVPVLTGVTGTSMSTAGYMNATGTDTNMQMGSSDIPYMLSTTQIATVAPTLYAGSQVTYNLYTGYSPVQTAFSIITGTGGYITTSDDSDLELGDTFIVETKGYVDTDSGSDKNIVYKEDGYITYVSAEDTITAAIATSLSGYSSTSDGYIYATDTTTYATAQAAATGTVDDSSSTFNVGQVYKPLTIVGTNSGTDTVAAGGGTTTVNLPSSVAAGDLLLILADFGSSGSGSYTVTTPSGWTQLVSTSYSTGTYYSWLKCYYKVAVGGESSVDITVGSSGWGKYVSYATYRITGYSGTPECGTTATGSSTNPDPPSLTPTWGSEGTLWIALCGYANSSDRTVSNYPSNYSLGQTNAHQTYAGVGVGGRLYTASSEDPGTFTISASSDWAANTVAIRPFGYEVDRGFLFFDTSSIPDGVTMESAKLYLYGETDESDTDFNIVVTNGQPTYPTDPLAAGDFDIDHYSGTGNDTFSTSDFSPSVEATNSSTNSSGTSHTVDLPSGIVSGDLLLVLFATNSNPSITFPAGWTELFETAEGSDLTLSAGYRVANGGEGSTITITTSTSVTSSAQSFRIENYSGTPEVGTAATAAATTNPDPPSLTPSWGARNNLWFAVCCDSVNVTDYPSGYSNGSVNGTTPYLASARLLEDAASDDPGVFTAASGNWVANTIAIKPTYCEIVFDSTGLGWIDDDGTTKLCIASAEDIGESAPTGDEYVTFYTAEQTGTTVDPQLVVYYWSPTVSVSSIDSQLMTVKVTADSSDLLLQVYDSNDVLLDSDTTALSGASVTDNSNDYVWGDGDVAPYFTYIKMTTAIGGSSEKLWYQPNAMVLGDTYSTGTATFTNGSTAVTGSGTTWTSDMAGSMIKSDVDGVWHVVSSITDSTNLVLTGNYSGTGGSGHSYTMEVRLIDRDTTDGSQDGAITWGANSNMTVTMDSVITYESASSTAGETGGYAIIDAESVGGWYGGGDITGLPLYDNFSDISVDTGIPIRTLYIIGIFAVALALGFGVFLVFKPMIFGFIASLVVVWAGSSMGIVPGWIVFSYAIMGFGIVYLRRQM